MKKKIKRWQKRIFFVLVVLLLIFPTFYVLQHFWAHRDGYYIPDYERVTLTENSDYDTILRQTGLGRAAVDKLLGQEEFQTVLDMQEAFFEPAEVGCTSLLGWFTREDRVETGDALPLVDLQPGDIVLTLSTHSAGWRHGHAGLVLDDESVLESMVLGQDSAVVDAKHWSTYSNYAILRIKGVTAELQHKVAAYGAETLCDVPYHLLSGLVGEKAPDPDESQFGLHCSYLVWYAWNHFGYDLDSDGGRLVTAHDLLHSELLEVVQIYGMELQPWL